MEPPGSDNFDSLLPEDVNTRAGWCLTTDNRLERRRGHVGVNANHLSEVKLGGCMRVWRESEVE